MPKNKIKKEKNKEDFECLDDRCSFKVGTGFKSTEKKVEDLKQAIRDLGYVIEETEEGIRISE